MSDELTANELVELAKLEARAKAEKEWMTNGPEDRAYVRALRNAAPRLLPQMVAEHDRAESLLGDVTKWQTRAEAAEAELVRLRNALAGVTTLEALGALKDSDPGVSSTGNA